MMNMRIWSRLGISMAIGALFRFAAMELLQPKSFYQDYRWPICLGLLTAGTLLWPIGIHWNMRLARRKMAAQEVQDPTTEAEAINQAPPFFLFNLAYWGPMLSGFGIILLFMAPMPTLHVQLIAARTNSPSAVALGSSTNVPSETQPVLRSPVKAVFPPALKLQGLAYHPSNASALISGRTYFVGDPLGKGKVVSIDAQQVVLEFEGERKVLTLDRRDVNSPSRPEPPAAASQ